MRRDGKGLGRTQVLVMRLLASGQGAKSARTLAFDWPGLTESAVRSALDRLGSRALVDAAGWDVRDGRTYALTDKGAEVERELNVEPLDEDEA